MKKLANVATNAAYLFVVIFAPTLAIKLAAVVLAIGSAAMHYRSTRWTIAADRFGMYVVFASIVLVDGAWYALALAWLCCAASAVRGSSSTSVLLVVGSLAFAVVAMSSLVHAAIALALFAFAYWLWRRDGGDWDAHPYHALWHVVTASMIVTLAVGLQ